MGRSEKETDIWGKEYIQHYDDDGNKAGTTRTETGWFGGEYEQHKDQDGNKTGYSEKETGWFGGEYEQHYDQDGSKAGHTEQETGWFGGEYEQHYDDDHKKSGYTEEEAGWFGGKYDQHFKQDGRKGGVHASGARANQAIRDIKQPNGSSAAGNGGNFSSRAKGFSSFVGKSRDRSSGRTKYSEVGFSLSMFLVPLSGIIGLILYVVEVVRTFGSNVLEGIAALLIAWLIIPIIMVCTLVVCGGLVLIAFVFDAITGRLSD